MLPYVSNTTTQILGLYLKFKGENLGYLSSIILEAKFGALTPISEANFEAKRPRPPDMEVPPWGLLSLNEDNIYLVELESWNFRPKGDGRSGP